MTVKRDPGVQAGVIALAALWLFARWREPSTWNAVGWLLTGLMAYKGFGVPDFTLATLDDPVIAANGQLLVLLPGIAGSIIAALMKDPNNGRDN